MVVEGKRSAWECEMERVEPGWPGRLIPLTAEFRSSLLRFDSFVSVLVRRGRGTEGCRPRPVGSLWSEETIICHENGKSLDQRMRVASKALMMAVSTTSLRHDK